MEKKIVGCNNKLTRVWGQMQLIIIDMNCHVEMAHRRDRK